jgi:hypothetical protein
MTARLPRRAGWCQNLRVHEELEQRLAAARQRVDDLSDNLTSDTVPQLRAAWEDQLFVMIEMSGCQDIRLGGPNNEVRRDGHPLRSPATSGCGHGEPGPPGKALPWPGPPPATAELDAAGAAEGDD